MEFDTIHFPFLSFSFWATFSPLSKEKKSQILFYSVIPSRFFMVFSTALRMFS